MSDAEIMIRFESEIRELNAILEMAFRAGLRCDVEVMNVEHFGKQFPLHQLRVQVYRPLKAPD